MKLSEKNFHMFNIYVDALKLWIKLWKWIDRDVRLLEIETLTYLWFDVDACDG